MRDIRKRLSSNVNSEIPAGTCTFQRGGVQDSRPLGQAMTVGRSCGSSVVWWSRSKAAPTIATAPGAEADPALRHEEVLSRRLGAFGKAS